MPLLPNGKLDRKRLPEQEVPQTANTEAGVREFTPRDNTEVVLKHIWEEVLQTSDVSLDDDFFGRGGNSLLAIAVVARLRRIYSSAIPIRFVFECSKLRDMATFLRQELSSAPPRALIPIQERGSGRPLFCVHVGGGLVNSYVELARCLGPEQPVFGLQSYGLDDQQSPLTTIEFMATRYLEEIRDVQRSGPYHLAGLSMGAVVAFEMARQLSERGEQSSLLALLDGSPARQPLEYHAEHWESERRRYEEAHVVDISRDMGFTLDQLTPLSADERLLQYMEHAKAIHKIPSDVTEMQFRRFLRVYATNVCAMRAYCPRPYPGRALYVKSSSPKHSDETGGWANFVLGGVEVHEIPGPHAHFVNQPGVARLSSILQTAIAAG
jgi:thioesterase domain-containing protein